MVDNPLDRTGAAKATGAELRRRPLLEEPADRRIQGWRSEKRDWVGLTHES